MASPIGLKYPVLVIAGPTASGKSSVAQELAIRLGAEIVSADSMQIYRGMDIGTAKVSADEMLVPHHLIDIVDPGEPYSAQLFQEQARSVFCDIDSRDKRTILCGGTGFYIQAAIEDMNFPSGEQQDNPVREKYMALAESEGAQKLWELLESLDSESAALIHPNNTKRVVRALEMHEQGISYAQQSSNIKLLDEVVPSIRFCLDVKPEVLVARIEKRVQDMFDKGLVDEVRSLCEKGFTEALTAPQAIGYKEVVRYLHGECSLSEAQEDICIATRRYAKRQRSWFRRDGKMIHIDATDADTGRIADEILAVYRSREGERSHV